MRAWHLILMLYVYVFKLSRIIFITVFMGLTVIHKSLEMYIHIYIYFLYSTVQNILLAIAM